MEITAKQQRNLYVIFIGLFAVNVIYGIINMEKGARLRKTQQALADEQLKFARQRNAQAA